MKINHRNTQEYKKWDIFKNRRWVEFKITDTYEEWFYMICDNYKDQLFYTYAQINDLVYNYNRTLINKKI